MATRRELLSERSRQDFEDIDNTPIHLPGADKPLTLREEMRRFIREELSAQVAATGKVGTFEEEDDFEIDDGEADLLSPYTVHDMAPEMGPLDDLDGSPTAEDEQSAGPPPTADQSDNSESETAENTPQSVTSELPRAGSKK